jgi:preprotein translocase subunit SecA
MTQIFGSRNQRLLKKYEKTVREINALESMLEKLSDSEIQAKTPALKKRIANGENLDSLLPEAFAVCREASKRVLRMRHFDVQLIGGMVLHYGKIAEMGTGEGKTLVATLPVYLNALTGKGVHVVTVNDYLAQRDAEWMGRLYSWLGLTTGLNLSSVEHNTKQSAYVADIVYGTNNEFGFDYLRDNMVYDSAHRVQRTLNFAILDEVDSILIDEARTPLLISGPSESQNDLYYQMNAVPPMLTQQIGEEKLDSTDETEEFGDYVADEKMHQVLLTESGHEKAEQILADMGLLTEGTSLYDATNINLIHHLYAALRAHSMYFKNQHYVVQNGEVVIVDEFTGRMMIGRRWSDGLHQAIEAKEGVDVQSENQTLASITFQNYFRMYEKLAGMTGTADTEASEFQQVYCLETVVIPQNRLNQREDRQDQVYKTTQGKYNAILQDIQDCYRCDQPVLVGTTSIENSELLSEMLKKAKLPHNVLNAKQHAREAEVVSQAGRPGAITIATNMAGRGTDIVLGSNIEDRTKAIESKNSLSLSEKKLLSHELREEWKTLHDLVVKAGGLHIIGTERHESRRVDNQLRGRAGRQGDPGSSRFYLSLEDPLLRIFAGDRVSAIMDRLKIPGDEPIEAKIVSRSIGSAQRKVEARNFDIRKQLLGYDDVANDQRKVIYHQRNELLESKNISDIIFSLRRDVLERIFFTYIPADSLDEQWDILPLEKILKNDFHLEIQIRKILESKLDLTDKELLEYVLEEADAFYKHKRKIIGNEPFENFEMYTMLQSIDNNWREHLAALDHLRKGIHLRSYAQKNPKQEYKREAFDLFQQTLNLIKYEVVSRTMMAINLEDYKEEDFPKEKLLLPYPKSIDYQGSEPQFIKESKVSPISFIYNSISDQKTSSVPKVGRNVCCPCGSGKKYKQCHGLLV